MKTFGLICGAIILMLFSIFTTMTLWNWFIPGIFGITVLTFWQTAGMQLVITKLTMPKNAPQGDHEAGVLMLSYGLVYAIMLLLGYIIKGLV